MSDRIYRCISATSVMRPYLVSASIRFKEDLRAEERNRRAIDWLMEKEGGIPEFLRHLLAMKEREFPNPGFARMFGVASELQSIEAGTLFGELFIEPPGTESGVGISGIKRYFDLLKSISLHARDFSLAVYCMNRSLYEGNRNLNKDAAFLFQDCVRSGNKPASMLYMLSRGHFMSRRMGKIMIRALGVFMIAGLYARISAQRSAQMNGMPDNVGYWRYSLVEIIGKRYVKAKDRAVCNGDMPWVLEQQDAMLDRINHDSHHGDRVIQDLFS